jgi:hypothetical protein
MQTAPLYRQDRRVAQRHRVSLTVRCGKSVGITRDLSATGVFFLTDEPLELGQDVHLSVTLHHADPVCPVNLVCRGRVCRVEHIEERSGGPQRRGIAVSADAFAFAGDSDGRR